MFLEFLSSELDRNSLNSTPRTGSGAPPPMLGGGGGRFGPISAAGTGTAKEPFVPKAMVSSKGRRCILNEESVTASRKRSIALGAIDDF